MGRGQAYDTLREQDAQALRGMLRDFRDGKGLKNRELAHLLGWGVSRVVDLLASGRPLRRSNAIVLLRALRTAPVSGVPGREARRKARKVNEVIDSILPGLERPVLYPPALIPAPVIPAVAAHLADIMSNTPGTDKKRRAVLTKRLERALIRAAPEMAYMFCQYFADWANSSGVEAVVNGYRRQLHAMGLPFKEKK